MPRLLELETTLRTNYFWALKSFLILRFFGSIPVRNDRPLPGKSSDHFQLFYPIYRQTLATRSVSLFDQTYDIPYINCTCTSRYKLQYKLQYNRRIEHFILKWTCKGRIPWVTKQKLIWNMLGRFHHWVKTMN